MRRGRLCAAATAGAMVTAGLSGAAVAAASPASSSSSAAKAADTSYVVLAAKGASAQSVATRLRAGGARVTSVNAAIGLITVHSSDARFSQKARGVSGVSGVATDRAIGEAPKRVVNPGAVEREHAAASTASKGGSARHEGRKDAKSDPLDSLLWGMDMINAKAAHRYETGDKRVTVGILDTGVQADHPDLAANVDRAKSRNFTTDLPEIDGPCEHPSCVDPATEDDDGHGTHVAGTIGAALNGRGVSGVAPGVTLVNIRGGQDSGFFFLGPVTNALTYAGDIGIDVVNMSFYVDPWLYNCVGGAPQDSATQAAEQGVIIEAMRRSLDYAHAKGVTLVAALGNDNDNISAPRPDTSSPDFGADPFTRTIDNSRCFDLPVEGPHVLGVSSLGPSGKKSDFSNWASDLRSGEIDFSAPGGWFRDGFGTPTFRTNENLILSSVPLVALQDTGEVDADGTITPDGVANGVIKQCGRAVRGATSCGYYAYFQGTSMASPHAAGVAALAVSAHGRSDGRRGLTMAPDKVAALMRRTATDHACPPGGVQTYTNEGRDASYTATCVGTPQFNGFYGAGIVNALGVVRDDDRGRH